MKELKGRVAVITGAASGIGLALAHQFGVEGMKLVIADIEEGPLENAVANLRNHGFEVIGVKTDVAKFESVAALATKALAAFGKVHVVCNNAGVLMTGPTWEMSLADWQWVFGVNVYGIIHGVSAFVPILLRQLEPAHIINTASAAAFFPMGEHTPYSASKAAAVAISECLYSEFRAKAAPIGVTCLCPGMVATEIHRSWRNRPSGAPPDTGDTSWSDYLKKAGLSPDAVARQTVAAVKADQFWVFTHDGVRGPLVERARAIAELKDPPISMVNAIVAPKVDSKT